ncbi:TIGR04211 family SH3 domain-containing protein, partial [Pseudomonadales bacterium]|nr:TIGR04211 family SH3 domain-containing protein [Pseudomonadales bacterium]
MATLIVSATALADTVYVRDTLYVPLRGGVTGEHRILHKGIRSGTAMELLEADPESGYSRVRLPDGLEGWIQTQYLMDTPIAAVLLEETTARLQKLEAEYNANFDQLTALQQLEIVLSEDNQALKQANEALTAELQEIKTTAANVIAIKNQNASLQIERQALEEQIDGLLMTVDTLDSSNDQDWFIRGAGTVLLSLLIGFIIARRFYHRSI